ncbi:MAG: hypothetical protein QW343_03870, partial [Candidatus Norongarragalinales archaeon]
MSGTVGVVKCSVVLAVFTALFLPSLAWALNYDPNFDELRLSTIAPQYFPQSANDSTTRGIALMLSSRLTNPFGASVGAAPGNNVNTVYFIIGDKNGNYRANAEIGDLFFYENGYYRKANR